MRQRFVIQKLKFLYYLGDTNSLNRIFRLRTNVTLIISTLLIISKKYKISEIFSKEENVIEFFMR